jgi:hypothetical protein
MIFQLAICLDFLTFGDLLTLAAIKQHCARGEIPLIVIKLQILR